MGFLTDLNYEDVPDLTVLPEGEYELRIIEAEDYVSKSSGKEMVRILFEPVNEANADLIYYYLIMPTADDDERKRNFKLRKVKEFFTAFGVDSRADYSEWVGATAWALLGVSQDQNGQERNDIKRFIVSTR